MKKISIWYSVLLIPALLAFGHLPAASAAEIAGDLDRNAGSSRAAQVAQAQERLERAGLSPREAEARAQELAPVERARLAESDPRQQGGDAVGAVVFIALVVVIVVLVVAIVD